MTNSIAKGKAGEREWANFLKEHGYKDARRGQQFKGGGDSPDVVGIPGVHQEVKRVEKLHLWESMEQSRRDAADDEIPIVVHRANRRPWIVIMDAEDFIAMRKKCEMLDIYRKNFDKEKEQHIHMSQTTRYISG